MKQKVLSLALALLLCLGLTVPALAAQSAPNISINWLSGMPSLPESLKNISYYYNSELNWLYIQGPSTDVVIDLETGARVDKYDCVLPIHSEGLAMVVKYDAEGNEKYGFIDKTGKVVVPLEYDDAESFSDGLAAVRVGNWETGKWGFIDKTGKVVVPLEYDDAESFSDGLAAVRVGNWETGKCGFIDKTGKVIVPLEYDFDRFNRRSGVSDFSNGLAWVAKRDAEKNWKYGFIDKTGAVVLPLEYDDAGFTNNDSKICWVRKGASFGVFENPYYKESGGLLDSVLGTITGNDDTSAPAGGGSDGGGFPVVPVVIGVVVLAAVIAAVVLVLNRKKVSPAPARTAAAAPAPKTEAPQSPTPEKQTPAPASGPKFCPNCGKPVPPGVKFCPECGHNLKGGEG